MTARIEELLTFLDGQRAVLREAVAAIPPARREIRSDSRRWSVAEVLEHLAIVEHSIARLIVREIAAGRAAGLGQEHDASSVLTMLDVERLADRGTRLVARERAEPRAGLDHTAAWAALERSRAELRAALIDGDGLALGELVQPHPFIGPLNLYQWVLFVGAHEARHARQIEEYA